MNVIATGPSGPIPDLAWVGAVIGNALDRRRLINQLNPLRVALEQVIQQRQAEGIPLNPLQQQIAAVVGDPKAYANLAGSYSGALELANMFVEKPAPKAYPKEMIVHHDDPINAQLGLGLRAGESAEVRLLYDDKGQLLPGHEITGRVTSQENASGRSELPFGSSDKGRALYILNKLVKGYVDKTLTPEEENAFYTSISVVMDPHEIVDEDTKIVSRKLSPLPWHIMDAVNSRPEGRRYLERLNKHWRAGESTLPIMEASSRTEEVESTEIPIPEQDPGTPTLWELAELGHAAGPIVKIKKGLYKFPGALLGKFPEEAEAGAFIKTMRELLIDALRRNPRYAEGEAERLLKALDLDSDKWYDSNESFKSRLVGFDNLLETLEKDSWDAITSKRKLLPQETRQHAMTTYQLIKNARRVITPPRLRTQAEVDEFKRLNPPGTRFLFNVDGDWKLYKTVK